MNYQDQLNAKLAAEREYLSKQNLQGQAAGYASDMCTNERQESTQERLLRRLRNASSEGDKLNRALNILNAHPEFEDLIWLIQSGLV